MAELRAYYYNQGDMLELVRYQKKKESVTEEEAEIIYSSSDLGEVCTFDSYSNFTLSA